MRYNNSARTSLCVLDREVEIGETNMTQFRFALVLLGILALLVLRLAGTQSQTKETPEDTAVVNDKQFHDRLLKIAEIYPSYGRVDDECRWAPWLCRLPLPGQAQFSRSSDETTHGQKLYSVFARDRNAYADSKPSPVGQVIVKEAWLPQQTEEKPQRRDFPMPQTLKKVKPPVDLATTDPVARLDGPAVDHFFPYAEKEGKWYKASQRAGLYIMTRLDPNTPGTDEGWVYGTVTADGKSVTSAGRVASCMRCHETKKERLFGLAPVDQKTPQKP